MSCVFYEESKGTGSPVIFLPGLGWPGWGHYVHWAPTPVTPFIREFLIKHEES